MRLATVTLAVGLVLAGCGGSMASPAPPKPRPSRVVLDEKLAIHDPSGRTVTVHRSPYGRILADDRGRALYLFTRERPGGKPRCYGACARAWPPFLTKGLPRAGAKVAGAKLGTVRRSDGRRQVTYAGRPLYYYVSDRAPGQVTCQAVAEYGGTWLVVDRTGKPVARP